MPELRDNTVDRRKRRIIQGMWFDRWIKYHAPPRAPVRFTLNNALLKSVRPRPVFISWFPEGGAPTKLLTPLSLNGERRMMRSWGIEPGLGDDHPEDLTRFVQAFRAMFAPDDPDYSDERAIAAMLGTLTTHFGDLGGQCFASFPAMVRVHSGRGGAADDRNLRAVLSISMKADWDAELYDAAWQFFTGIANQVLCDVMTSEYVAIAHAKWEHNKSNAVYLTSHPLGHRLASIKTLAEELKNEIAAPVQQPARAPILAEKAKRLFRRTEAALGFVNYINLLSDMLNESAALDVEESRRINRLHPPILGPHWLSIDGAFKAAASKATDKMTGRRAVLVMGKADVPVLVPRRLSAGKLMRHSSKEDEIVELIFSELLENVANSGATIDGSDIGPVPVIFNVTDLQGSYRLTIENLIDQASLPRAVDVIRRRHDKTENARMASGMTLTEELVKELKLGGITSFVKPAMPFRWPGLQGADRHVWITEFRVRI